MIYERINGKVWKKYLTNLFLYKIGGVVYFLLDLWWLNTLQHRLFDGVFFFEAV